MHILIVLGYDHPQGQGKTVHYAGCQAKWDLYIPHNMVRYPYVCLVARGSHSHHPPYPTRLPKDIADDVIAALQQGDILALTPRMYSIYSVQA
jgi:hypothetical protein